MTSRDFVYWLQGFFEITGAEVVTEEQVKIIRNHMNMVFAYEIDPSFGGPAIQEVLDQAHQGHRFRPQGSDIRLKC